LLDPHPRIVKQHAQRGGDFPVVDADVLLGCAEGASPAPYIAEHLPVQVVNEFLAEQVTPAAMGPTLTSKDIVPLSDVQFVAKGDMRWKEGLPLLCRQRRRVIVRLVKNIAHISSHKARGSISSASSSSRGSTSFVLTF
jgi:hypothetical protein